MRVSKVGISGFSYILWGHTHVWMDPTFSPFVNIIGINCKSHFIYCFQPSQDEQKFCSLRVKREQSCACKLFVAFIKLIKYITVFIHLIPDSSLIPATLPGYFISLMSSFCVWFFPDWRIIEHYEARDMISKADATISCQSSLIRGNKLKVRHFPLGSPTSDKKQLQLEIWLKVKEQALPLWHSDNKLYIHCATCIISKRSLKFCR